MKSIYLVVFVDAFGPTKARIYPFFSPDSFKHLKDISAIFPIQVGSIELKIKDFKKMFDVVKETFTEYQLTIEYDGLTITQWGRS